MNDPSDFNLDEPWGNNYFNDIENYLGILLTQSMFNCMQVTKKFIYEWKFSHYKFSFSSAFNFNCMMSFKFILLFSISNGFLNAEYLEVSITSGQPIFSGNSSILSLDNLRVRKVNKTDHLLVGSFEIFEDVGNDFDVSWTHQIFNFYLFLVS